MWYYNLALDFKFSWEVLPTEKVEAACSDCWRTCGGEAQGRAILVSIPFQYKIPVQEACTLHPGHTAVGHPECPGFQEKACRVAWIVL